MRRAVKTSCGIALAVLVAGVLCMSWVQKERTAAPSTPPPHSSSTGGPVAKDGVKPDGASLAVHVLGPDGTPIEHALVQMWRVPDRFLLEDEEDLPPERRSAREIGKGEYRFDRPPAGSCSIGVQVDGFVTGYAGWDAGGVAPILVRLQRERPMAGVVLDGDGNPVAGADIRAGSDLLATGADSEVRSDAAGGFTLHGLGQGEFEICASADGFADHGMEHVPGGAVNLRFTLRAAAPFEGRVVAEDDGRPIAGAKVHVSCLIWGLCQARTDAQGLFQVRRVPTHDVSVLVMHEDFVHMDLDPAVVQGRAHRGPLVIRLQRGLSVAGKVIDGVTGAPVASAAVETWTRGEEESRFGRRLVKTDAGGGFQLKGLPAGAFTIHARKKVYLEASVPVAPEGKQDLQDLLLVLGKGGSIAGRVLDPGGNPIAGAQVTPAVDLEAGGKKCRVMAEQRVPTDPEGRFRVEGMPSSSSFRLLALHREFTALWTEAIQLRGAGGEETIEMRLYRGGTIRGRVLDGRGGAVPWAHVAIKLNCPECLRRNYAVRSRLTSASATNEEGLFVLTRVPPGSHQLEVLAPGGRRLTSGAILVREGETTGGVDLLLESGGNPFPSRH